MFCSEFIKNVCQSYSGVYMLHNIVDGKFECLITIYVVYSGHRFEYCISTDILRGLRQHNNAHKTVYTNHTQKKNNKNSIRNDLIETNLKKFWLVHKNSSQIRTLTDAKFG